MLVRRLATFATFVLIANGLLAEQKNTMPDVGDHIVIKLTGDAAQEYRKRIRPGQGEEFSHGLRIETFAMIQQKFENGQVRFEHSMLVNTPGFPDRLVILSGTVNPDRISTELLPKQQQVFANPGSDSKLIDSNVERHAYRLEIPNLVGLKLQTWTLSEEVGN